MAGLARALKHGPRRSFGKSRHNEADPSPPKLAPVTKPKPKSGSKGGSDEKEEKSGGFLFRRRSFNEKKTTTSDDDSYKGSPRVSKKFGLKIGGSGNKKPPVKSKPVFSSSSTGENDSILSEDIPQVNNTAPRKTFEPKQDESPKTQKASTPYKEDSTPPSRRERTPNERDSSLFKDPPSLFGHRSVLFGSAEFDAIFDKYSKEDEEEAVEPTEDDSKTKQLSERKPTPDRKPTPSKKPEISTKPSWTGRGSTSSDKPTEQKSGGSRVSEGRALFERPKSAEEEATPKRGSGRRGFGGVFSKYEEAKTVEEQTTNEVKESKKEKEKNIEVKKEEKAEEIKEDSNLKITTKDEDSSKPSLFEDDSKVEAMDTTEESEAKVSKKRSLFDKYETESATTNLFKDVDGDDDDDKLFGDKDKKKTAATVKKTVYESLFSTEEQASTVKKTGSLFDEEHSDDDDELFKTTKKPQKGALDLSKSADMAVADKEAKVSSLLTDEEESPLFGKPKSPVPDLFSEEKEEKEEKAKDLVEDDVVMDTDKDKTESEVKNKKEDDSPGLFDKPSSPLFESEVQRSTSIFEGKRSKSEEDLFQIEQKGKDLEVKETDVVGGYLLVDMEKKKEEATRSSLFDDDKLVFDDSDVLPKLEKDNKEKKGLFEIDDFVMVENQEESTAESLNVEDSTTDPLSDGTKEKNSEVALEDFPPKQSVTEDEPQDEAPKESGKEKESDEVPMDSDKLRTRHKSAEKKRDTSVKVEQKSSTDDRPAWMVEAQRRKERRLLEKEKEKEKKLQATKEKSPTTKKNATEQSKPPLIDVKLKKSNISATTSVAKKPVVEDDMPEWQKKLMERKQRVAEQKKTMLSSRETTYTSRRERQKDTATTSVAATSSSVKDKKKEDDKVKEQKDDQVEEKEQKETEEQPKIKTTDEEKEKSKSPLPSPLPEKPLLSPKPTEVKSPTRTASVSSQKPELKRKPSVEVTISSTKRETRRPSAEQDKDGSKENLIKEPENETEKSFPLSKRRTPSGSDKKTVSVSSKVSTSVSSTKSTGTSSDSVAVPKWKRELQQKKVEPEKKGRDTVVSPTQDSIPEWKRQLLEKRKQQRTPTPTDDKKVRNQKHTSSKQNYRIVFYTV